MSHLIIKKSFSKRKVCIIFIKNKKIKKIKTFFLGFFGWVYCQPCLGQPEAGGGGALVAQPAIQALPLSDDAVSQLALAQPARIQAVYQRVQV